VVKEENVRTKKQDIYDIEGHINRSLRAMGYSHRVSVQWAYGRPRAYLEPIGSDCGEELSPRLPMGEMYRWLWAYYKGLCMGLMVAEEQSKGLGV